MGRTQKTKEQLLQEITELRAQLAKLENTQIAFTGAMTDITERKQVEQALREQERFLTAVFESIQDGLSVLDPDLTIRHTNGVMKKWYERNLPLEGKKCYEAYHNNRIKPCKLCPTLRCIESGKTEREVVPGLEGSPIEWIELFAYPMKDPVSGQVTGVVEFVRDITERKLTEQALRESEEKFRSLVTNIPSVLWTTDSKGITIYVSPNIEQVYGFTPGEIYKDKDSKLWLERIHPDDAEKVKTCYAKLFSENAPYDVEYRLKRKDGKWIWLYDRAKVHYEKDGLQYAFGVFSDITERKQAEEKSRLLSIAVEQSHEGIGVVNTEGYLLFINDAFARMHGYSPEEVLGKHLSIFHTPEQMTAVNAVNEGTYKTGKFTGEVWHVRRDGSVFPTMMHNTVLLDEAGNKIGIVGTARDVTELKKAEEALQYQLNFENLVTEISTNFINLPAEQTDHGIDQALKVLGRFAGVDRTYVFHVSEDTRELINTHEWCADGIKSEIDNLQHVSFDTVPWWMEELRKLQVIHVPSVKSLPPEAFGEKRIFEEELVKSLIAVPMVYNDRLIGFVGFDSVRTEKTWGEKSITLLRIIAEIFVNTIMRHKSQQELENYHHKMFRAEQLASLGIISATIAHELNQPLTVIQLLLQQSCRALGRKKPDIDKIVENLNDCLGEVSRTVTTVDRFRKFAIKSSPIDVRKVDLAKTALAIVSVLKRTAKQAKLTMSVNIDKSPLFIRGNIAEFEQIFFVVIQNAIQASDAKRGRKLKISLSSANGQILLEFADTCGGVDPENADRIFEPFFTTKPGEVGTGLGLCILERIVKRYDGLLRFENQPGHGITFYITLPVKS